MWWWTMHPVPCPPPLPSSTKDVRGMGSTSQASKAVATEAARTKHAVGSPASRGELFRIIRRSYDLVCCGRDSQTPHAHSVQPTNYPNHGLSGHNYCRSAGAAGTYTTIWCYTTDANVRWEYCDPIPAQMILPGPYTTPTTENERTQPALSTWTLDPNAVDISMTVTTGDTVDGANYLMMFGASQSPCTHNLYLRMDADGFNVGMQCNYGGNGYINPAVTIPTANTEYTVRFTYDASSKQAVLYVNGQQEGSGTKTYDIGTSLAYVTIGTGEHCTDGAGVDMNFVVKDILIGKMIAPEPPPLSIPGPWTAPHTLNRMVTLPSSIRVGMDVVVGDNSTTATTSSGVLFLMGADSQCGGNLMGYITTGSSPVFAFGVQCNDGSDAPLHGTTVLEFGTEYHVEFLLDAAGASIWINGQRDASADKSFVFGKEPNKITIGAGDHDSTTNEAFVFGSISNLEVDSQSEPKWYDDSGVTWQPLDGKHLSDNYESHTCSLVQCKQYCLGVLGCDAFSWQSASLECRVPKQPDCSNQAVKPNQANAIGTVLYNYMLRNMLTAAGSCVSDHGTECRSWYDMYHFYGQQWGDRTFARIDLTGNNGGGPLSNGGYNWPHRAPQLCRSSASMVPGASYIAETYCAWMSICIMDKQVVVEYKGGTNTETGDWIRTVEHTFLVEKTTVCNDDSMEECRTQKKCTLTNLRAAYGCGSVGSYSDCGADLIDGTNSHTHVNYTGKIKEMWWDTMMDHRSYRAVCGFE